MLVHVIWYWYICRHGKRLYWYLDNANIKNVWRYTSTLPHVSMEWCFILHINNSISRRPTRKLAYTLLNGKLSTKGYYVAVYSTSKLTGLLLKARWKFTTHFRTVRSSEIDCRSSKYEVKQVQYLFSLC